MISFEVSLVSVLNWNVLMILWSETVALLHVRLTQKQPPQVFYRKSCSWKIHNIHRKTPALESLLKRDSNTDVFLWISRNFQEHLFWRTSANGCFCWLCLVNFFEGLTEVPLTQHKQENNKITELIMNTYKFTQWSQMLYR